MKIASLIAAAILLFSAGKSAAQPKRTSFNNWKKIGVVPPDVIGKENRGLAGPVAGLINDRLLVAGGCYFPDLMPWEGGRKIYTDKGYFFYKDNANSLQLEKEFQLPLPLAYSALCGTEKGLAVLGGENAQGASQKAWIIQYNAVNKSVAIDALPNLPVALSAAVAVSTGTKIYVAGGENQTAASSALYMLDLAALSKGWQIMSSIPHAVSHAVIGLTQYNGSEVLLLAGGRCKRSGKLTPFYKEVYYYNLHNDQWTSAPNLPYAIAASAGLSMPNGSFAIFGGDRGTSFHQVEKLMLAINNTRDSAKLSELTKRKAVVQSSHPGFSKEILVLDQQARKWVIAGALPFQTPVTTVALWWDHKLILLPGEIRAGVRTPDIFMGSVSNDLHE